MSDENVRPKESSDVVLSYDAADEPPSDVVVRAVAGVTGRPTTAMTPLYDSIDPDALDALAGDTRRESNPSLSFVYADCCVHVDSETVAVGVLDDRMGEQGG